MQRREFLKATLAGVATAATTSMAHAERAADAALPIVDTHQHLWDLDKFQLPWLKDAPAIAKSYVMADYLKATAGLNVVKAVYMEVDVTPMQQQAEADFVSELCRRGDTPTRAAVISGRPAADDFPRYIDQFKDSKFIKGIRQVLHGGSTPAGYCLDPKFVKGIQRLGDLGLSFDLCMRPGELSDGAKLADACPNTRFILDHCGNADVRKKDLSRWKKEIATVAMRKNVVVCKISGIVANATPGTWTADDLAPAINHTLDVFGPDRVQFGGDWPVCTLAASFRQWVDALKQIVRDRPIDQQRRLFHDNAVRIYGLA
jgi:predicted TIM-barrel fold metal-dependent hydrolase